MRSLKLVNGDLSWDSTGKIAWVRDEKLLIQSINLRLSTLKENLFYDDSYGHPIFKGKLSRESLESYFKDSLLDDERIEDLEIIHFEELDLRNKMGRGIYNATMLIYTVDGQVLEFEYAI